MLGLHHEIHGGELSQLGLFWARLGPRHHDDLRGPGESRGHPHHAADLALRLRHVGVTRAGDDVDPGDGGGAVGHGTHGLCTPDAVDLGDAGDGRCGQGGVVHVAVGGRRHAQSDVLDPGHPGRRSAHEHRRGIAGPATGGIDAGPAHGTGQVGHADPARFEHARGCALVGVIGDDAGEGQFEGVAERWVDALEGFGDFGRRDAHGGSRVAQVYPVELRREFGDRLVPLETDPPQDLGHHLVHIDPRIGRAREEAFEGRLGATEIEQTEGHEDSRLLAMRDLPGHHAGPTFPCSTRWEQGAGTNVVGRRRGLTVEPVLAIHHVSLLMTTTPPSRHMFFE